MHFSHARRSVASALVLDPVAVAVVLVVLERPVAAGTDIFGDITLGGVTLATMRPAVCLQAVAEQGARRVLLPILNAG
jgi:ATP-dependent Lon protease